MTVNMLLMASVALLTPTNPLTPSASWQQTQLPSSDSQAPEKFANFNHTPTSLDLIKLLQWIRDSSDNQNHPYLVIDKINAQLFVFQHDGEFIATTPVLLGMSIGDKVVAGSSQLKLKQVPVDDRITPAGRFVLRFGHDLHGQDIFWVDYDASISMHRILESIPKEHRRERLASETSSDNRISYGCINVSKEFYEKILLKMFRNSGGIAYILPEQHALSLPFR